MRHDAFTRLVFIDEAVIRGSMGRSGKHIQVIEPRKNQVFQESR